MRVKIYTRIYFAVIIGVTAHSSAKLIKAFSIINLCAIFVAVDACV